MLDVLLLVIAGLIILIGSLTDLQTREVPDWLNYAGIAAGFLLRLLMSGLSWSYEPFLSGILGFGTFFVLGCVMYYTGQWGGGDAKLLMALGALFGFEFRPDGFAIAFLVNVLLAGAAYGMCWIITLALLHIKKIMRRILALIKLKPVLIMLITAASGLVVCSILAIVLWSSPLRLSVALLGLAFPVFAALYLLVKSVELCCMYAWMTPDKLTEGDWLVHGITIAGRRIVDPSDLGVQKDQLPILQKLYAQGKIKRVLVKNGIPFVPSFLLAFAVTLLVGNVVLLVI